MSDTTELAALLREIRDQQREQLRTQAEALALQREHFAMARVQLDRAERINDRADAIQARASTAGKIALWLAVPALALILLLVLWSALAEMAWF
jgi:hypothetical protein